MKPDTERDALILMWWEAGESCQMIGSRLGMDETRVIHEVNRILREAAERAANKAKS